MLRMSPKIIKKDLTSKFTRVPKGRCIAIIGDIVGSRKLGAGRSAAQKKLFRFLDEINRNYRSAIIAKFIVTTGDEFQGLLNRGDLIPDLIWDLEIELNFDVRLGIGCGKLNTPLQSSAIGMDGPVWYAARAAIQESYVNKKYGGVFKHFDADDPVLNGLARILHHTRTQFTGRQLKIVNLLRDGSTQADVAARLKITRQAVSRHAILAGWNAYDEAERSWKRLLGKFAFTDDWQ